ncbi:proline-specific peptidase [Polyporus arcularius HHB13444]|uniref:Proline-specific peptidase n=1 Tax=Polyporus arcularius HHB13444 TaxID=1314778 RepID=A0A5C3PVK8_9APHY|nr:proline-specific peptidase [Polyporus arcularius HHB13444]
MKEGFIPFAYEGETHQTYYKVFGDLENLTRTPIVVLHGGPGLSYDYVSPHADLADDAFGSFPVIFYDQLGNGRSTHLPDKPSTFWTIDLFLDELENLLTHFGISGESHIVGHSWGGMMGAELVVRRHPTGLKRLVIANSPADLDLWDKAFDQLLAAFPSEVKKALAKNPDDDKQGFYEAIMQVYAVHGCRVHPFPEDFVKTIRSIYGDDGDRTVDRADITKNWSIVDRLHLVDVPTLVINARYDIAQDFVVAAYVERIPDVKWAKFENSSHTPCWEERPEYMHIVAKFLGQ